MRIAGSVLRAVATPCLILGLLVIVAGWWLAFSWPGLVLWWVGAALFTLGAAIQVALLLRWLVAR